MPEDYEQEVTIKGFDGTVNRTIKVTIDGQLYTLMVGANGVVVAVDVNGNMSTIMQGTYGTTLKTLLCDSGGRLLALLTGMFGTTPTAIKTDSGGQLYTLMVGANGQVVAVDATGNIQAVMQGQYGGALKTLLTDSGGRLLAQLMGMSSGTPVAIACDATGALKLVSLAQSNVEPDANEAQTWDVSLGTLLNNLNRIRYMIVTITGEAWGTVSHSIATVWAKFHATTGHAHTGTGTDAPTIDHGTTTGLTDDDHVRYYDKDLSKPITGQNIVKSADTGLLRFCGGTTVVGKGAGFDICGCDHGSYPGQYRLYVPNAAKTGTVVVQVVTGDTDTPVINWQGFKLTNVADPAAAQDAATKNYVDTSAIAKTGFILLWSGSIATIPTGWILCNGGGTTPNLKNRFVVGAGDTYAVGATGGEATHALTIAELAAHTHGDSGSSVAYTSAQAYRSSGSGTDTSTASTGSGTAHENRPPYYALAYIMKT